ncbi:hypothetical protein ACHAWF_011286, partial [Thalassiosira exigua]
ASRTLASRLSLSPALENLTHDDDEILLKRRSAPSPPLRSIREMTGTAATAAASASASAEEAELVEGPARRRRAERGLAVADGTRSTAAASSSSLSSPPLPLAAAALLLLAALAADAAALVGPPPRPPSAAGRSLRRTRATALGYQTGAGGAGGGRGDDAFAAGSKRAKNKKKGKKKNKKKKGKDDFSFRGNLAPTTREELAREVQSALSDDWREFDDDAEEGDAEDGEVEAAVDGDEPCDVSSVSAGRKVRNNCLELEKRPALVLNADYQVREPEGERERDFVATTRVLDAASFRLCSPPLVARRSLTAVVAYQISSVSVVAQRSRAFVAIVHLGGPSAGLGVNLCQSARSASPMHAPVFM